MKRFSLAILVFITIVGCHLAKSAGYETSTSGQSQSFTCTATCPTTCPDKDHESHAQKLSFDDPSELIDQLINATTANTRAINQLKDTLSDLKNRSYTTGGVVNNILLFTEELLAIYNTTPAATPLPSSCNDIKQRMPSSPSGVYLIAVGEGKSQYVYCHMETLCNSDEGWTRLAHIDMTDSSNNCPGGLRLYEANEKRACGRPVSSIGSCHSVKYSSNGVKYSKVCGRVIGYSYNSPDAIDDSSYVETLDKGHHNDINSYYVDGISLTRGNPRQHIWTFMAGFSDNKARRYECPCQKGTFQDQKLQPFIGSDYYCEAGGSYIANIIPILYTADPLWDGKQCAGLEKNCCARKDLPWFYKLLQTNTSDYIEMRVCGDESTANEDTSIEQLEVYVA